MNDLDTIDRDVLDRYWAPEIWFSRVGTHAERNNPRAPIAKDPEPRGALRSGGERVPTGCVEGELIDG